MKICHSRQWLLSGSCVMGEPEAYSGSQIFSPALWKSTNPLLSGEPEKELLTPRCLETNTCFCLFRSSGRGLKRKPDGEQEGWMDLWILKLSHGAKRMCNLSALFCAANRESYTFLEYVFTVCDSCAPASLVFRALPGCFKNQLGWGVYSVLHLNLNLTSPTPPTSNYCQAFEWVAPKVTSQRKKRCLCGLWI